ncbi:hypothetical protein EJB05_24620 [Eragrostis curvula]|uniref:Uncharacterized protein n=1 Tax=Eragrostis curvula TaxID=38414 RepID=A0A5J9VB47_9POAL|nr:hypothetical protein EJB05_24620 [Eragrostis curvula]
MGSRDYYEILNVDRGATDDDDTTRHTTDADNIWVYDEYGEEGLRGEVPQAGGGGGGSDDILPEFLGSTPFTYCNTAGGGGGGGDGSARWKAAPAAARVGQWVRPDLPPQPEWWCGFVVEGFAVASRGDQASVHRSGLSGEKRARTEVGLARLALSFERLL